MYTVEKAKRLMYKAYHHDDAILLQFFIYEFIATHLEIETLKTSFEAFAESLNKRTSKKHSIQLLQDLIVCTRKLTGANYDSVPHFYWNNDYGLLHKLNNYAALFSRTSSSDRDKALRIYQSISQSVLSCIHLHNLLLTLQEVDHGVWKEHLPEISRQLIKLTTHIKQAIKCLPSVIEEYKKDENVVFFILRHRKEIETLFVKGSVKQLLEKMYSEGLSEAKKILIRRYQSRGFTQLLPIISEIIDNIQNNQ